MDRKQTDLQLWRQTKNDDADAFAEIYRRHARSVTVFILRKTADPELADDLGSAVFLEVWRKRSKLDPQSDSLKPLLIGTAANQIRNQWRTKRLHGVAIRRLGSSRVDNESGHEDRSIERSDALARINLNRDRLSALPRVEAEALAAVALGDLTYEEAAEMLGIPVGTVRSRISRARKRFAADCPDPKEPLAASSALKGIS